MNSYRSPKSHFFSIFGFLANYGTFSIKRDSFTFLKCSLWPLASKSKSYSGQPYREVCGHLWAPFPRFIHTWAESDCWGSVWMVRKFVILKIELALASWPRGERMVTWLMTKGHIHIFQDLPRVKLLRGSSVLDRSWKMGIWPFAMSHVTICSPRGQLARANSIFKITKVQFTHVGTQW